MLLLALFILVFLAVGGFIVFLLDGVLGKEDFASELNVADEVAAIIKEKKLERGILYDLGSGHGRFAAKIAKGLPNMKVWGIDDNGFRIALSKARSLFVKNIKFKKENIFSANLSSANIVYIYLPQELMQDLQTKLQKELKPGVIIITNKVNFPSWQPIKIFNQLFIKSKGSCF